MDAVLKCVAQLINAAVFMLNVLCKHINNDSNTYISPRVIIDKDIIH